jgi:hypothetical protein
MINPLYTKIVIGSRYITSMKTVVAAFRELWKDTQNIAFA